MTEVKAFINSKGKMGSVVLGFLGVAALFEGDFVSGALTIALAFTLYGIRDAI